MTTPKRKIKKPSKLLTWEGYAEINYDEDVNAEVVQIGLRDPTPKECRKLAAWLLRAANYLEDREK